MSEEVPVLWLVARASGLTAFLFLTLTVVLGIAAGGRTLPPWWPRFLSQGLHRGTSATAMLLLAVHVVALVVDPYVVLSWTDMVVPFRADYKSTWTALGTLAVDVLLLVLVATLFRLRLGPRLWRLTHITAYAAWALALLHGLGSGTDTDTPAVTVGYALSFVLVLMAVLARAARRPAGAGARLTATEGRR